MLRCLNPPVAKVKMVKAVRPQHRAAESWWFIGLKPVDTKTLRVVPGGERNNGNVIECNKSRRRREFMTSHSFTGTRLTGPVCPRVPLYFPPLTFIYQHDHIRIWTTLLIKKRQM